MAMGRKMPACHTHLQSQPNPDTWLWIHSATARYKYGHMAPGQHGAQSANSPLESGHSWALQTPSREQSKLLHGLQAQKGPCSTRWQGASRQLQSMLQAGMSGTELPALKALLFWGAASNSGLAYKIRGLSKVLSEIATAVGMLPDWKSDTASRAFFSSQSRQETFK